MFQPSYESEGSMEMVSTDDGDRRGRGRGEARVTATNT